MFRKLLLVASLLFAPAAHAQWREATSQNFVVYSEGSEANLREFANKLEKFDYVLRAYHGVKDPPSPVKLRVFLFPNMEAVGRIVPGAAGFYLPNARGLMMVGTRDKGSSTRIDAESVLLHEYTHHFMYQYFPATYPSWYSEGFAEFWGATRFLDNGVVEVGLPVEYRYASFFNNRWLPIERLLTAKSYSDARGETDLLYAQGWLLVRYAFDNAERQRQLQEYLRLINDGTSYEDAMHKAFGDIRRLNSELFNYAGRSVFKVLQLPFKSTDFGEIKTRELSSAEQALIRQEVTLSRGLAARQTESFAREVRQIANRFESDPYALALLSEAERLAGHHEQALATADRLLQLRPDDPRGLLQKALLQVDSLKAAGSSDQQAWEAARRLLVRANNVSPNNPLILEAYYDSFAAQGVLPPEPVQNALYTAMELAPSDGDLRYKVAADFERRNMVAEAIAIIRPEAYRLPHRGQETEKERRRREEVEERYRDAQRPPRESAREMLDRLEQKLAEQQAG